MSTISVGLLGLIIPLLIAVRILQSERRMMRGTNYSLRKSLKPPTYLDTRTMQFSKDVQIQHRKTALVTGASRGIGQACAIALAEAGANICLVLRKPEQPNPSSTLSQIQALGTVRVSVVYCDLADLAAVKTVFDRALEVIKQGDEEPHIDILVNGAAIIRRCPSVELPEEDWDEVMNVNLKACLLLSQAAGRHMLPRKSGKIINISSLMALQGGWIVAAYAASKGALSQLTKALSNEWAAHNIQVNAICPGYVKTDMNDVVLSNPTRMRQISERLPAGRWGEPRDFSGITVYLASAASQWMTGESIIIDGGWMAR